MKKNRMMRLASILLVCVLLTTSVISGTFAKYITEVESSDTARVACWGFTGVDTDVEITDLFQPSYDNVAAVDGTTGLIAPGTSNKQTLIFEYDGAVAKPEVAYTFTVDTTGSVCDPEIVANTNIQWALVEGDVAVDAITEWGTFESMINKIKALSGEADGSKEYAANSELPAITGTYTIAWQWLINEVSDADDAQNVKDTALGNADPLNDVVISIKITAEQKD